MRTPWHSSEEGEGEPGERDRQSTGLKRAGGGERRVGEEETRVGEERKEGEESRLCPICRPRAKADQLSVNWHQLIEVTSELSR